MSVAVQTMTIPAAPLRPQRPPSSSVDNDQLTHLRPRLSFPRRPLPPPPAGGRTSTFSSPVSPASPQRPLRSSFVAGVRSTALAAICANTKILRHLLPFLSWHDLHALSGASRALRRVFLDGAVKDAVFVHFIPAYRIALRLRDKRIWEDSIRMDYADLGLLMASLDTPLHRYPMHALSVLSSDLPTWEQMQTTRRFQLLSQVHSRAVLLLQSMIHSTSQPLASELDDARSKTAGSSPTAGLRELTFPAPLSYFDADANIPKSKDKMRVSKSESSPPSIDGRSTPSLHASAVNVQARHSRRWRSESAAAGPSSLRLKMDRSAPRRLSIFGGNAQRPPLPEPSEKPPSLRYYSGNWRRSYYMPSVSGEDGVLKPPNRRFVSSQYSSDSSLGGSPTPSAGRHTSATPDSTSPHDLYAATKRTRAPVLRVFVPCAELSEDVITECENQLIDDGLWAHMSVGDVVCNFGYVPPIEDAEGSSGCGGPGPAPAPEKDHRRWLVFSGARLAVYDPARAPPIPGALELPSPFYYTHILPALAAPRFRLALALPRGAGARAQYTLARLATTLHSPHSPSGHARVHAFAWLAALDADAVGGAGAVGAGWRGAWVLQGEGTREGRVALQDALAGDGGREAEYEVDLEKSGGGRLWLRMLTPAHAARGEDEDVDFRISPTD